MYKVAPDTLESADKCQRNYVCLNEETPPLCPVKDCVNCEIHFISVNTFYCAYFLYFGDEVICTCPVRKELFNKYEV